MTNCWEHKTKKMLHNDLNGSPNAKLEFNKEIIVDVFGEWWPLLQLWTSSHANILNGLRHIFLNDTLSDVFLFFFFLH